MATVVPFTGISYLPVPREKVLQGALDSLEELGEDVLVLSLTDDGELWFSGSTPDVGAILLLLEQAKLFVVENAIVRGKSK